jgi:hypothetical protein
LCARVLKARYYPKGKITDTVFAANPSPVWKGIAFGLELLKECLIYKIGNGKSTQFSRDNWIPRVSGLKIATTKKNSRKRWVHQLMNPDSKSWNTNTLKDIFFDHDVEAILKINIPQSDVKDRIAWHLESNGVFSAKSAYHLAQTLKHQNRNNTSTSSKTNGNRSIWDLIWKADVPPKVCIFAWCVATDSLPTKKNKWRQTLETNGQCNVCGSQIEDAHHVTVGCTKAAALIQELRGHWKLPKEKLFRHTRQDWLQILLGPIDKQTRDKTLLLLWRAYH